MFAILAFAFLQIFVPESSAQQWGIGISSAASCNQEFAYSQGAAQGSDQVRNIQGRIREKNQKIDRLKQTADQTAERIDNARKAMAKVLTPAAIRAIEEHASSRRDIADYANTCPPRGEEKDESSETKSISSLNELPTNREPADATPDSDVSEDSQLLPPPGVFCIPDKGVVNNTWKSYVLDGGRIQDRVCDFYLIGVSKTKDENSRYRCRLGVRDFQDDLIEQAEREQKLAKLEAEISDLERQLSRTEDDIAEGRYAVDGSEGRRGYGGQPGQSSLAQGVMVLGALAGVWLASRNNNRRDDNRRGGPPAVIYPGGGGATLARPYRVRTPGYYNVSPDGEYGSIPSGVGQGSFGCANGNPRSLGNAGSGNLVDSIFGGNSPVNNRFANDEFASQFNQGGNIFGFPSYRDGLVGLNGQQAPEVIRLADGRYVYNGNGNNGNGGAPAYLDPYNLTQNGGNANGNAQFAQPYYDSNGRLVLGTGANGPTNIWAGGNLQLGAGNSQYGSQFGNGNVGGAGYLLPVINDPALNFSNQVQELNTRVLRLGNVNLGPPDVLPWMHSTTTP